MQAWQPPQTDAGAVLPTLHSGQWDGAAVPSSLPAAAACVPPSLPVPPFPLRAQAVGHADAPERLQ